MFKIISEGRVIALCDRPVYIRLKPETGAFVSAKTPEQRQGIAVKNLPYNLPGHKDITRMVYDEEKETMTKIVAPEADIVEVKEGIVLVEGIHDSDILCELDASIEELKEAVQGILEGKKK